MTGSIRGFFALSWLGNWIEKRDPSYRISSLHNRDLMIFLRLWCGLIIYVGFGTIILTLATLSDEFISGSTKSESSWYKILPIVWSAFGVIFTVSVNQAQKTIEQASRRLGVVDLFTSEILSVMNVIVKMRLMRGFKNLHNNPSTMSLNPKELQAGMEKYTEIFEKNASELGTLRKDVVESITRFYTYLRASRDATRRFSNWDDEKLKVISDVKTGDEDRNKELASIILQKKKEDVEQVVLLLSLSLKNGFIAAIQLLDDSDKKRIKSLTPVIGVLMEAMDVLNDGGLFSQSDLGITINDLEIILRKKLERPIGIQST